jgi:hypothetical protein
MDLPTLRAFFLWCTILNGGLLVLSSLAILAARDLVYRIHSRWFAIPRPTFDVVLYGFLGVFKAVVVMLNLVPYLALAIVG